MTGQGTGSARVLIIADSTLGCQELVDILKDESYEVAAECTLEGGLQSLKETPTNVVLLDIASPKNSCFEICSQIQAIVDVPIILISAEHDEVGVASTLERCATDYITRPIRARELGSRIRAILRRTSPAGASAGEMPSKANDADNSTVVVGPIEIHLSARRVFVSGEVVELSHRDFDLLVLLASPPGRLRTREELIDRIWAGSDLSDTRTLDKHIRRLRAKIDSGPDGPRYLLTVHGVGFRFMDPKDPGGWSK